MTNIRPSRSLISDRFPVASFVVRVPESRCFEVACATDPSLFRPDSSGQRTPQNFFSTRWGGLLRAPQGEATVLLPPGQLQRFAGAGRVYYAMGSYTAPDGQDPRFSVDPTAPGAAPFIRLATDFSGRGLRSLGGKERPASARYGGDSPLLWGGDLLGEARSTAKPAYDDGFNPSLWGGEREAGGGSEAGLGGARHPEDYPDLPEGAEQEWGPVQAAACDEDYVEAPSGWEPSVEFPSELSSTSPSIDQATAYAGQALRGEPEGFEDGLSFQAAQAKVLTAPEQAYGGPLSEPEGMEHPGGHGGEGERYGGLPGEPEGLEEPTRREEPLAWGGAEAASPLPGLLPDPPGFEDGSAMMKEEAYGSPAAASASPSKRALTPQALSRIVRPVFRLEGGPDAYGRADADERGLVWGMAGFNQRDGSLREVLAAAWGRDQAWYGEQGGVFARSFGEAAATKLGAMLNDDVEGPAQLQELPLEDPRWVRCFARAGSWHRPDDGGASIPSERDPFKVAQNQVAVTRYLLPALPLARELGFTTDRSLAMLYDRVVHMGQDRAGRWIRETLTGRVAGGDLDGDLSLLVARAEAERRPWASRLHTLRHDHLDLDDSVYELDA